MTFRLFRILEISFRAFLEAGVNKFTSSANASDVELWRFSMIGKLSLSWWEFLIFNSNNSIHNRNCKVTAKPRTNSLILLLSPATHEPILLSGYHKTTWLLSQSIYLYNYLHIHIYKQLLIWSTQGEGLSKSVGLFQI